MNAKRKQQTHTTLSGNRNGFLPKWNHNIDAASALNKRDANLEIKCVISAAFNIWMLWALWN